MARPDADIQTGMFNSFQRLIDIALESKDLQSQQTDLLNYIAGNSGQDPAATQSGPMPTPERQIQSINNNIDVSPIVNELSVQTNLLGEIASILREGQSNTMNPGESAIKNVAVDEPTNEGAKKAIGLIVLLGGAFVVLAMGLGAMQQIDMKNFITISAGLGLLFATLTQVTSGGIDLIDILLIDALIKTYARSLVDMSIILQDMTPVAKEKMMTLFALSATVIPLYGILSFLEYKVSTVSSISLALFGVTLPSIAKALVATGTEVAKMPSDFKLSAVSAMLGLSAAMFPLVLSAGRLFEATAAIAQATGLDSILNRLSFVGGELSVAKRGVIGPNFYLSTLFRIGATLAMLPLIAMSMLGIAWMFSAYQDAGGKFIAPPIKWSLSIGIAMMFFANAISRIIFSLDPTMIQSVEKWNGKTGQKTIDRKNISKSNIPGALAVIGALAIAMVTTGYIMSLFPSNAKAPDQNWIANIGIGLILFSMALKRIVSVMGKTDSRLDISKSNKKGTKTFDMGLDLGMFTGMMYMASMALSMVIVARILNLFPRNPIAPPILWTLSVGLSMLIFAKAYQSIATVTTKSGGLLGAIRGGEEKNSSVGRAMGGLLYLNLMALSIVSVAMVFQLMPKNPKSPPIGWTLSTGLSLILFSKAAAALYAANNRVNIKGEGNTVNFGNRNSLGQALGGFTFLIGVASAIVATAWIFQLLPSDYKSPEVGWILKTGAALLLFSLPLTLMLKAKSSKQLQDEGKGGSGSGALIQISFVAMAIVAAAWIFMLLPGEDAFKAPPLWWVLNAGGSILIFGLGLVKMQTMFQGNFNISSIKEMGLIAGFVALSVVAVAWLFQTLPNTYKSPDLLWTVEVGLSMALFVGVLIALKKFNLNQKDVNSAGLTVLKIAVSVVAVAWLFELLPADQKSPDILLLTMTSIMIVTVGGSLALLGFLNRKGWIDLGTKSLDNILLASITVAAIMFVVGKSNATFGDIAMFAAFLGVMVIMSVSLALLGKRSNLITQGALVLEQLARPIAYLAIGMAIWSAAKITLGSILLLGFTVGVIASIGMLIGGKDTSERIRRGLWVMTLMSIPLMTLGLALLAWQLINPNPQKTIISLLLLTAVVGVFSLIGFVIGHPKAYKRIVTGLLVMTLAALPIIALGYAFKIWNEVFPDPKEATEKLALFGVAMTALAAGLFVIGQPEVALAVGIGAGVLALIGGAILIVGKGISSISDGLKVAMESGAFKDSGQTNLLGMKMTNFEVIMQGIARGFAIDPISATLMAFGVPAYLGASVALLTIGKALKSFEDLDINTVYLAGQLIPQVLNVITDSFAEAGKKNSVGFIKGIFVKGPVADGIDSIKGAGKVLAEITTGLVAFANMKFTDEEGNTIMLNPNKLKEITGNIVLVLDTVSEAFKIVGERNKKDYGFVGGSLLGLAITEIFTNGPVADGINATQGMGRILTEISKGLVSFADMKFTDAEGNVIQLTGSTLDTVSQNIVRVLTTVSGVFAQIGVMNKKDYGFAGGNIFGMAITEMFTDGPIADGVNATQGMGLILSQVAEGLVAFADMKFTKADGTVVQITDDVLAMVTQNVSTVMTALGKVFADIGEGYNAGGFMGFFGANQVQRGVEAVQGLGTELVNIVTAVKNIADFTFTDADGNQIKLDQSMLFYDPKLSPTDGKQGSVIRNIAMVVSAVAAIFADIGKNSKEDTFWFPANLVQKGVESVKGVGAEMVSIANALTASVEALKATDSLDMATLSEYNVKVPMIMGIIPKAVIDSILMMKESVGDPKEAFNMVNMSTKTIADAIEKIAKYQEPIEKVANSFEKIATSMGYMRDAIETLDVIKLDKMNSMFSNIREIAYPSSGLPVQDIPGQVAEGIYNGIQQSTEETAKLVDKLEKVQSEANKVQAKIADAQGGGGGASAEFMLDRFTSLEKQIEKLNNTMELVVRTLGSTLNVKVSNTKELGTNL